jgi:hypothetical protein
VRLHRFLLVQIENNILWAASWVLKRALIGLPTASDNTSKPACSLASQVFIFLIGFQAVTCSMVTSAATVKVRTELA